MAEKGHLPPLTTTMNRACGVSVDRVRLNINTGSRHIKRAVVSNARARG